MLRHFFILLTRIHYKQSGYTLFNVLGLSVGMSCAILIACYVLDEIGYDQFHLNASRVYRIVNGQNAKTPAPLGPTLEDSFSEVQAVTRLAAPIGAWLFRYQDRVYNERMVLWAGESTFEIFDFPFLQGDSKTALANPYSVVITEDMAMKYFNSANPIGKTIRADDSFDLTVTGVIENLPLQSHFHADFFISNETQQVEYGQDLSSSNTDWIDDSFYTYLLVQENTSPGDLEEKIQDFLNTHISAPIAKKEFTLEPRLQSLDSIYLSSNLRNELRNNGNLMHIYILTALGLGIVLLSCINFVNMSTARAMTRAREVGIRKLVGAYRSQLVMQFFGETLFIMFLSVLATTVFLTLVLPVYTNITGKSYVTVLSQGSFWLSIGGIVLFTSILSGIYPAFVLSAYRPVDVIKGVLPVGMAGILFRKGLVVIQFAVTIGFIVGALVVLEQWAYMNNTDLGFDKDNIIVIPASFEPIQERYDRLKEALLQIPEVVGVTTSSTMPGRSEGVGSMWIESVHPEGYPRDENVELSTFMTGYDFIQTLGLDLIAGRDFSPVMPTDKTEAFIFNERAIERFGWEVSADVVGRQIDVGTWRSGKVIGVVRNFHMSSLHKAIEPTMIIMTGTGYISVRVRTDNIVTTVDQVADQWERVNNEYPLSFSFLDEDFNKYYERELLLGRMMGAYTALAMLIACLGLSGLAAFMIAQRRKEIGVRKVLGASSFSIVVLLNRSFLLVILLANAIAWPLSYYILQRWLQNFTYRIDQGFEAFFLAGTISLAITLFTVSYHTFKASRVNPVETLR